MVYFLYWRLRFGLTRYFDADELAHLHWGHNYFAGQMPYTDFFYIFPPYFLFLLSFLWRVFGETVTVVTEARVVIFVFFLILLAVVFLFGRIVRNSWVGLLAIILLSFIPIPYDKMIEIRPDLPATAVAFVGIFFLILASQGLALRNLFLFLSGLFYGISFGIIPKTIFFIPPALLMFGFWYLTKKKEWKQILRFFGVWTLGLLIPVLGIILFAVSSGNPVYAFSLMTKIASDASLELVTIYNHSFYMFPTHFFWPNQTFYGEGGMNFQYYVNLFIWITGSIFAIFRMVGFLAEDGFKKQAAVLLLASSFFFNLYGFMYVFPLKHSQYLVPLVPFVSLFFADFINSAGEFLQRRAKFLGIAFNLVILAIIFYSAQRTNLPKAVWTNINELEQIVRIEAEIPAGSFVFDLSGYALKFRDPYYYCCVPFGQYWRILPYKPSLAEGLKKTNTNYVVNKRIDTLPDGERQYVEGTYTRPMLDGFILSK